MKRISDGVGLHFAVINGEPDRQPLMSPHGPPKA